MDVAKLEAIAISSPDNQLFYNIATELSAQLTTDLHQELIDQGHKMTGKLMKTTRQEVKKIADGATLSIIMKDYAGILDKGTAPNKIPYYEGSGRGESEYIKGLEKFWTERGATDPLRAAFATARKQRNEGMPTARAYGFSPNGERLGFIDQAVNVEEIEGILSRVFERAIEVWLTKTLSDGTN